MEHSSKLMQVLLTSLRDNDPIMARKSIIIGTNRFCNMLYELSLQFHRRGIVERWLEELWTWMIKFKDAVFSILLEGTAHTGPALTPAEVLVAIHDINPDRDGLALEKITDACSACFEQQTVFTGQVVAKALDQMVNQTPLPLPFVRAVIQAIDAFPTLVDFVMEILSKLVNKQVRRMPKLWIGFLKCVSQTQPHSFRVLLQLPSPQLEGSLKKFANLRAYANQSSIKTSLPRSTPVLVGLANEPRMEQPHQASSLHSSETSSSSHGATLT